MRHGNGMEKVKIIAPIPGSCPVCATMHGENEPHDLDSLYYRNQFFKTHKRFPTWSDALHHCSPAIKEMWAKKLGKAGIQVVFSQNEGAEP